MTTPDPRVPVDAPLADFSRHAPLDVERHAPDCTGPAGHQGDCITEATLKGIAAIAATRSLGNWQAEGSPDSMLTLRTGMSPTAARAVAARASLNGRARFTTSTEVQLDGRKLPRGASMHGTASWTLSREGRLYTLTLNSRV